ncbi:MAG: hypothetical protein IM565_09565 [Pseudanabaena sp. M109S1SP2A07QC]|jgi:hypothetical protein|nr:hypothetical protein [Pseudanabaena sp. M109S1SP2A07QC]
MIEIIAAAIVLTPAQIDRVTRCDRFLSVRVTSEESNKYFQCIRKIGFEIDIKLVPTVKECRKQLSSPFWNASKEDKKAFRNCLKGI